MYAATPQYLRAPFPSVKFNGGGIDDPMAIRDVNSKCGRTGGLYIIHLIYNIDNI